MKIYQIGKSIIVEDAKSVKNITQLRTSITSSLELIKVAINNDLSVSEYLTKIMSTKEGDFSKRGLNKNQTAEFINNYAITLKDERTDGEVTYIFDMESYKRYKDGQIISEDGWRFTKLGALRLFNGDVKLTWKIKIRKENFMIIKTKFQPIGKEYPFTYKLKKLFFEEIQWTQQIYC